jgi:hypothetical protein
MKKSFLTTAGIVCASMLFSFHSLAQEAHSMEWISVSGNRLQNERGEAVVFRGVNLRDPHNLAENGHWTKAHFNEAMAWGANVIRLPVHPRAWRERGEEGYLPLLDSAVAWAGELGLYLIIDWHSIGNLKAGKFQNEMYNTTVAETFDFWKTVSARYADEPAVAIYELFNEPTVSGPKFGKCTWTEWKEMNHEMIRIIRANHPKSVIAVAGFDWAYDLTPVRTDPIDAEGIVYISHPYPQKREAPWEKQWDKDWGFVAATYPVILTEIGFALPEEKGVHMPVQGDETYGNALVKYTAERDISWVVWCFDPDWAPFMFSDWNYTPTRQGAFFRKVMKEGT